MTSITRLPTGTPFRPVLKPLITLPPILNPNSCPSGCFAVGQLLANTFPVRQMAPTYWATTVSPSASFGPEPLISGVTDRLVGGELPGKAMEGATPADFTGVTVGSPLPPLETCGPDADCEPEYCCSRSITQTRVSVPLTPSCDSQLEP